MYSHRIIQICDPACFHTAGAILDSLFCVWLFFGAWLYKSRRHIWCFSQVTVHDEYMCATGHVGLFSHVPRLAMLSRFHDMGFLRERRGQLIVEPYQGSNKVGSCSIEQVSIKMLTQICNIFSDTYLVGCLLKHVHVMYWTMSTF